MFQTTKTLNFAAFSITHPKHDQVNIMTTLEKIGNFKRYSIIKFLILGIF